MHQWSAWYSINVQVCDDGIGVHVERVVARAQRPRACLWPLHYYAFGARNWNATKWWYWYVARNRVHVGLKWCQYAAPCVHVLSCTRTPIKETSCCAGIIYLLVSTCSVYTVQDAYTVQLVWTGNFVELTNIIFLLKKSTSSKFFSRHIYITLVFEKNGMTTYNT